MSSTFYPINAPVEFVPGASEIIDFNAVVGTLNDNIIQGFVTSAAGDLIYAGPTDNQLVNLGIGFTGDVLTVAGGVPTWAAPPTGTSMTALMSTGASAVTSGDAWQALQEGGVNDNVVWGLAAPGGGSGFVVATGVYTVPADGIYDISAQLTFEANNSGGTGPVATAPAGRATRQLSIILTGSVTNQFNAVRQAEASKVNNTTVSLPSIKLDLDSGDTITIRARHDASAALNVVDGYLSIHRVS